MKVQISSHLFAFVLILDGVISIGTLEPDGTVAPQIPDGFLAPDGEITDPSIPNPAPEFPAPADGTPNISSRPFYIDLSFTASYIAKTDISNIAVVVELIPSH